MPGAPAGPALRRLKVGDTAGWKPALRCRAAPAS